MKKLLKSTKIDYISIILIFIIINLMIVSKVKTLVVIPDEVNTLAIPAALSGSHWELVNSYYGWGGSIFYYPLFLLIKNPIVLYRNIIMLNSVLLAIIPCIAYMMSEKFFQVKNRKLRFLLAFFLGIYPGTFAMSQYGWNETWIRVITWIILLILFKLVNEKEKKRLNSFIFGVLLAYSYAIHGRMLVFIPITVIIYVFLLRKYKNKFINIKYLIFGFLPIFLLDIVVKKQIKNILFRNVVSLRNTFSDTMINSLKALANLKIFVTVVLRATTSYTFYVGITSFGIVFLAIILLIKLLKIHTEQDKNYIILGIFSVIGILFSVLVSVFFFMPDFHEQKAYIWGRYTDHFTSLVIFFVILLVISKKLDLKYIYYSIAIMLILSVPVLIIETGDVFSGMADINILSLISFVPNYVFDSPEKFYMLILFLIILSTYILFMLKENITLALIVGIAIYSISNAHLEYKRIEKSDGNFSVIGNSKYGVINILGKYGKQKLTLNFISNMSTDIHPITYLLLLNKFNVNYSEDSIQDNIKSGKENISMAKSEQESLLLDKDVYKIDIQSDDHSIYNLYYKGKEIKKFLDSKNILSKRNDTYNILLDNLYTTNGNIKENNNLVVTSNSIMYGPYIELRPNHYKVIITGEGLNKEGISFLFNKKGKGEAIISEKYTTIKKEYNEFIGEFNVNDFIKGFETIIENKSNSNVVITSVKIIAK